MRELLSVLRCRDFAMVWSGQVVSALGDAMLPVAVTTGVLGSGGGAAAIGGLLAARGFAILVVLLAGGLLADRFRRTRVMLFADALRLCVVLGITAVLALHAALGWVSALMFVYGVGEALFRPAYRSLSPRLVPSELLQPANALSAIALRTTAMVGPAVAGLIVVVTSPLAAMWFDAATFGVSIATLLLTREPFVGRRENWSSLHGLREGVDTVLARRWLWLGIGIGLIQMPLAVAPWYILLPGISLARYGSVGPYGLSLSVYAAGGLLGATLSSRLGSSRPGVPALVGVATFSLVLAAMALPVPAVVLIGAHLVAGAGLEVFGILWMTALQRDVPDHLLARVTALDTVGSQALLPMAYAGVAVVARAGGGEALLVVGAIACLVTTLPMLLVPGMRTLSSSVTPEAAA